MDKRTNKNIEIKSDKNSVTALGPVPSTAKNHIGAWRGNNYIGAWAGPVEDEEKNVPIIVMVVG